MSFSLTFSITFIVTTTHVIPHDFSIMLENAGYMCGTSQLKGTQCIKIEGSVYSSNISMHQYSHNL